MQDDSLGPLTSAGWMFSSPRLDRDLVALFFMTFARSEFALKRAGYVRAGRYGPVLEWDKFADALGDGLFMSGDATLAEAVSYLTEQQPKQQAVVDGQLRWEIAPTRAEPRGRTLVRSVKTVRNNLFHGGKDMQGPLPERDRRLLRSCVTVLAHAVTLVSEVRSAFFELPPESEAA